MCQTAAMHAVMIFTFLTCEDILVKISAVVRIKTTYIVPSTLVSRIILPDMTAAYPQKGISICSFNTMNMTSIAVYTATGPCAIT